MNEDPNYLLIAQDVLYQIIGNDRDVNYWIFQGNPKVFDFENRPSKEISSRLDCKCAQGQD